MRAHPSDAESSGFNPCSRGCLPETFSEILIPESPLSVSILVLVDACRKLLFPFRTDLVFEEVSILVLVDACRKQRSSQHGRVGTWSFNPCSRGCLPETFASILNLLYRTLFQSLFSWMPAGNKSVALTKKRTFLGFNPCSRGCLPETFALIGIFIVIPKLFQSLFSWMPAGNIIAAYSELIRCTEFQSLFSWMPAGN